jgi:hypothetical protein
MILSIDVEKAFDKIQHPFMINTLKKLGIEGMFLNIIKTKYDKPRANIILNGKQMKPFLLKLEMRKGCQFFPLLFNIVLELLARAIRQGQEVKGIQIRKEEVKQSLFADDLILYLRLQKLYQILLQIVITFSKVQDTKLTYRNQYPSYISTMNRLRKTSGKEFHLCYPPKQ